MSDDSIPITVITGDTIIADGNIMFDVKTGEPYHYKNGVWYTKTIAENRIKKIILDELPPSAKKARYVNETYEYIQLMTQKKIRPNPNFVCVENGALNVHHFNLTEHKRELMSLHKLRIRFDRDIDYSDWSEFVMSLCESPEDHDTLQEFIGYCFTPGQTAKKLLYIYGLQNSGKSTFYNIISWFFGKYNTSTLSLNGITDKFLAQNLRFKMVNIRSDIEYKTTTKEVQKIKSLTGGDKQTFDKKFLPEPIEFRNDAKIMLSGNGVPNISASAINDDAFCSRWIYIRFPYSFSKKEGIEDEWKRDSGKSQILKWALMGLKRLRENNWEFTKKQPIESTRDWLLTGRNMNPVDRFLTINYIKDSDGYQQKQDMYEEYKTFCRTNGYTIDVPSTFHSLVSRSPFFDIKRFQPSIEGKQIDCWRGLKKLTGLQSVKK